LATVKEVLLPDIGDFKNVDVIEVLVAPGDKVDVEDSLITLESDKATIEVPAPEAGVVRELKVKVGDKVSKNSPILTMEVTQGEGGGEAVEAPPPLKMLSEPAAMLQEEPPEPTGQAEPEQAPPHQEAQRPPPAGVLATVEEPAYSKAHASPSVRRFARELGVDLGKVQATGPKGRILKENVQSYVKMQLARPKPPEAGAVPAGRPFGLGLPEWPEIDFSAFGPVETQPLTKIRKLAGANLHRNWLYIPHVTQFDEADITELEAFRQDEAKEAEKRGVKLTLLTFLMKAAVAALREFPEFNASLDASGENLILKKYFHIGVAVDTPQGLVVPVIRDVDRKGLFDLARELRELSSRARERKLTPGDMQGGCFTISSLGGLGGTAFTPILNAPEVAILGVSRAQTRPSYLDGELLPRLILPLSLSYDHRVIDGAAAVRFTSYLATMLSDTRRLLL
jgi:pyruvate dehydrogenase E2 component (dihydrolipoamide acetyltransferase)